MADPDPDELTREVHEVLAGGYLKDHPHYCLVRNSWGTWWGLVGHDGYFLIPLGVCGCSKTA